MPPLKRRLASPKARREVNGHAIQATSRTATTGQHEESKPRVKPKKKLLRVASGSTVARKADGGVPSNFPEDRAGENNQSDTAKSSTPVEPAPAVASISAEGVAKTLKKGRLGRKVRKRPAASTAPRVPAGVAATDTASLARASSSGAARLVAAAASPSVVIRGPSSRGTVASRLLAGMTLSGAAATEALLRRELPTLLQQRDAQVSGHPTVEAAHAREALAAALQHCAGRGLLSCVRLLLENGVPVDGETSIGPGHPSGGQETRPPSSREGVSTPVEGEKGGAHRPRQTPLSLAASRCHVEVCKELIVNGANVEGARRAVERLESLTGPNLMAKELAAIRAVLNASGSPAS